MDEARGAPQATNFNTLPCSRAFRVCTAERDKPMNIRVTEPQNLAARKLALPALRKLGVKDVHDYKPHTFAWAELNSHRAEVLRASRSIIDSLKDNSTEGEARSIEDAHEALLAVFDAIEAELDIRNRIGNRAARDNGDDPKRAALRPVPRDGSSAAMDGGFSGERSDSWRDKRGEEVRVLAPKETIADRYDRSEVSFGDAVRAMLTGPRNEAERRALSEGTDSAGGFTVPKPLSIEFIDRLRAQSTVIRAGARTVPMESDTLAIARLDTDPTVSWKAENAALTDSDPTFSRVLLDSKTMGAFVRVSRELLDDSINASQILENAFARAFALELDRVALIGSGASNQPLGITGNVGIGSVSMGVNGLQLTSDRLVDLLLELEQDNAGPATGMIMAPRTMTAMRKLKDGQGQYITLPEPLASMPKFATTALPINETQGSASNASSIITGNFEELLIGMRMGLRVAVLNERYAENYQVGLVGFMRVDIQLAHVESFARLQGIIP
jgi:HK97 family phage major capsid protein